MSKISPLLLCLLSALRVQSQTVPYITFMDNRIPNHGYLDFDGVGKVLNNSVQCHTDLSTCCSSAEGPHRGDWYFPSGSRLPFYSDAAHERRTAQLVVLFNSGIKYISGIYSCTIAVNGENSKKIVHVGLYHNGGDVSITDGMKFNLNSDNGGKNVQFTLTCVSTGGPATNITWIRNSDVLFGGKTVLDDPETAQYTHTLTVTGRLEGHYQCIVANNKPSHAAVNLTVQVASAPSSFTAVQAGPTSIQVSWIIPTPLGDTNGYRVYYIGGSTGSNYVSGGSTSSYLLTGLENEANYRVFVIGVSNHLPSEYSKNVHKVSLIPSKPRIVAASTSITISVSWWVLNGSLVRSCRLTWVRDTARECSYAIEGSATINDGSTSYIIKKLEEGSVYTITLTARNNVGSVVSDPVYVTTIETPPSSSPTSVAIKDFDSSKLILHWEPVDCKHRNGLITGYRVQYWMVGNKRIHTINVAGRTTTKRIIKGLEPGTAYFIQVAAVNSAGTGVYSDPYTVTPAVPSVLVRFLEEVLLNHSYVDLRAVGRMVDGSDSVQCHSDLRPCCNLSEGAVWRHWYAPGQQQPLNSSDTNPANPLYESHETQRVDLRHQSNITVVSGLYRCTVGAIEVKGDNSKITTQKSVFVGLYTDGGDVSMSGNMKFTLRSTHYGEEPQYTLTCTSTGGPATNITWTRNSEVVVGGKTVLDDPVTAQYTHTLTVTGRLEGHYQCIVANNKPSKASAHLTVEVPDTPTHLTVIQNGLNSVLVSWMTGGGAATVTGYTIYYQQEGGERRSLRTEAGGTTANISGLISGATYSITVEALSTFLPSNECLPYNITTDMLEISLSLSSSTMAGGPVSLNCSVTLPGEVSGTPVFRWVGPGSTPPPVDLSTSGQMVTSTLTLSPVRTSQAGQYTCSATLEGCSINSTVAITVQLPMPVVTISGVDNGAELNSGSSLSLICSIQPQGMEYVDTPVTVVYSWDVPSSGHEYNITNQTNAPAVSLDIVSLTASDSGSHSCRGNLADSSGSRYIMKSEGMAHTLSIRVSVWIQLRLSMVSCFEWVTDSTKLKLEELVHQVLNQLSAFCQCEITTGVIKEGSFACFEDSANHVTYRAKLSGTSTLNNAFLLPLLETWVFPGPTIKVWGVLLRVDRHCSGAISSLSMGECSQFETLTNETDETQTTPMTENAAAMVGGTVAIALILTLAVTLITTVALSRCQHEKPCSDGNKAEMGSKSDIDIDTNLAYECVKEKSQEDDLKYEELFCFQPPASDEKKNEDPLYETIKEDIYGNI